MQGVVAGSRVYQSPTKTLWFPWWYMAWSAMRTCTLFHCNGTGPSQEPLISSFARLPQFGIYSLRGLHACRNLIFIYSLVYLFFIGDYLNTFLVGVLFSELHPIDCILPPGDHLTSVILFDWRCGIQFPTDHYNDPVLFYCVCVCVCMNVHAYMMRILLYTQWNSWPQHSDGAMPSLGICFIL